MGGFLGESHPCIPPQLALLCNRPHIGKPLEDCILWKSTERRVTGLEGQPTLLKRHGEGNGTGGLHAHLSD